ncbi:MAG: hypothetical protein RLZZ59_571 [Pseudomonadota bacterium]|jgi:hypothetical protein
MNDILDEVLNDKNEENKVKYFKKAIPLVLIVTLLVVIVMIFNNWRSERRVRYSNEMGDILFKSLENLSTDPKLVLEGLNYLVDHSDNHMKDIASLQLIGINISSKNLDNALELAKKVADDKSYLDLTRSYAKFIWISIIIDSAVISNEEEALLDKYFSDFRDEKSPFYGSVNLMKAIYYQKKDQEKAVKISNDLISNKFVTPVIKDEARALLSNISVINNSK